MIYKLIIIALALSVDAFGIGITYGIRGIKISTAAKLIISFQAIAITLIALEFGSFLRDILPPELSAKAGAFLLILLGIWIIIQSNRDKKVKLPKQEYSKKLSIFIKHFKITIQIIRSPQSCDIDNSATIDTFEAIYLGFALSIDAFAAVTGTGIIGGFSSFLPFILAITQVILLALGTFAGRHIKDTYPINPKIWTFCSGLLLIVIAILSLI